MVGQTVTVFGYVTAVRSNGFYMQDSPVSMPYSGIYVYTASNQIPTLAVGYAVTVVADVLEYYGLSELMYSPTSSVTVYSSTPVTFTPMVVTPATIGTTWYASQRAHSSDH